MSAKSWVVEHGEPYPTMHVAPVRKPIGLFVAAEAALLVAAIAKRFLRRASAAAERDLGRRLDFDTEMICEAHLAGDNVRAILGHAKRLLNRASAVGHVSHACLSPRAR